MAEAPYRFAPPPRAGRRANWADLAQIWRSPARSGLFLFFPYAISICYMNAANKINLKMLWTSKFFDSKSTVIYTILSSHWYCMCNF
jgi:hypothetical protein